MENGALPLVAADSSSRGNSSSSCPNSPDLSLHWTKFVSETQSTPHLHVSSSSDVVESSPNKEAGLYICSDDDDDEAGEEEILASLVQRGKARHHGLLTKKRRRLEFFLKETISSLHSRVEEEKRAGLEPSALDLEDTQTQEETLEEREIEQLLSALVDQVHDSLAVPMQSVSKEDEEVIAVEDNRLLACASPAIVAIVDQSSLATASSTPSTLLLLDTEYVAPLLQRTDSEQTSTPCTAASIPLPVAAQPPCTIEKETPAKPVEGERDFVTPFAKKRFVFYDDVGPVTSSPAVEQHNLLRRTPPVYTIPRKAPAAAAGAATPLPRMGNHLQSASARIGMRSIPRPRTATAVPPPPPPPPPMPIPETALPAHLQQSVDQAKQVLTTVARLSPPNMESTESLFSTGTGRQLRVTRSALAKASGVLSSVDNAPPPPSPPPSQLPVTTTPSSLFTTASNKQCALSKTALDKAQSAYALQPQPAAPPSPTPPPQEEEKNETMQPSLFSTGSGKRVAVSQSALARAEASFLPQLEAVAGSRPVAEFRTPSPLVPLPQRQPQPPPQQPQQPPPPPQQLPQQPQLPPPPPQQLPQQPQLPPPPPPAARPRIGPYKPLPKLRVPIANLLSSPNPLLLSITSANAICVSFAIDPNDFILSDAPCAWTLETLRRQLTTTTTTTTTPPLPTTQSKEWVANHFRWIVWKLACQDRLSPSQGKRLTMGNVLLQLEHRAQMEASGKRSIIHRLLTTRELDVKKEVFVLMFSALYEDKNNPAQLATGEVSDGWYAMECSLDEHLTSRFRQGQLRVGQKLVVSQAQLAHFPPHPAITGPLDLSCNQLVPSAMARPLQQQQPRLLLCANTSRPANWNARLGAKPVLTPIIKQLGSIHHKSLGNGSTVSSVRVLITRLSPLLFREDLPLGRHVVRNQAEQDALEAGINTPPRQVSSFLRLFVADASRSSISLTVWHPSAELRNILKEGSAFEVCNLSIAKAVSELRLNAGPQTRWREIDSAAFALQQAPRQVVHDLSTLSPQQVVDLVVIWVHAAVGPKMIAHALLLPSEEAEPGHVPTLITIRFGAKQNRLFHQIPHGTVVCCRDLHVKSLPSSSSTLGREANADAFITTPEFVVVDVTSFCFDAQALEAVGYTHFAHAFARANEEDMENVLQASLRLVQPLVPTLVSSTDQAANPAPRLIRLGMPSIALTHVTLGRKTIDARRFKGPIANVQCGSTIKYECGALAYQEVVVHRVQLYSNVQTMLRMEDYKLLCPWARNEQQALDELCKEMANNTGTGEIVCIEFEAKDAFPTAPLVLSNSSSSSSSKKPRLMMI